MATAKCAGELRVGDEIVLFPGMTEAVTVTEMREVVTRSGESNPDLVKVVTSQDAADPKDAFNWPITTQFMVTHDSAAATFPEV